MLDKAVPPRTLKLNAADNVAVAVDPIDVGVSAAGVTALKRIPRGHKIALVPIFAIFVAFQNQIIESVALTGTKG